MTTPTPLARAATSAPLEPEPQTPSPLAPRGSRLPRYVPYAVGAASLVFAYLLLLVFASPGIPGVVATAAALYAVAITIVSRVVEGHRWAVDRLATTLVTFAFAVALIPLVSLLWTVGSKGAALFSVEFLTTDMVGVFGDMTSGGVAHAIVGTLAVTATAAVISVPIGLLTAIYLVEYGRGRVAKGITFLVDVMTGIPSIVAGLFAFALFTLIMGPAYRSGLMGAVALAVLMTPVVIRSVEEMLRLVPNELREAAYALGVPKWLTIVKVVLRTAVAGIVTGIMLAVARVIGETAPLLITVGILTRSSWNVLEGRMATLPVFAYNQYQQGGVGVDRAWAAALTLILIVMILNLAARMISRVFAPKGAAH